MRHSDYTVGWLCALPREQAAVFLDEVHEKLPTAGWGTTYILGRIDVHNVVVACLPETGIEEAAYTVSQLEGEFKSLRLLLLVGVAGGAPSPEHDIRLGDIVVSGPSKKSNAILQWDRGTQFQGRRLQIRDIGAGQPDRQLLTAVSKLQTLDKQERVADALVSRILEYTEHIAAERPGMSSSRRPGEDVLFKAEYEHLRDSQDCDQAGCDHGQTVLRKPRSLAGLPKIHQGPIASANRVLRDAMERDRLAEEHGVLCFEMEAAGLKHARSGWLVIRGICDYCDSHKNKVWQDHAALAAAAYGREVLAVVAGLPEGDEQAAAGQQPGSISYAQTANIAGNAHLHSGIGMIGSTNANGTVHLTRR